MLADGVSTRTAITVPAAQDTIFAALAMQKNYRRPDHCPIAGKFEDGGENR